MISKSISVVLGILSLLALALPTGVVSQTAQAQSLGSDIANDVLDSVFGDDDDGEEAEAEDDSEDDDGDTQGDDNQNIDQTADQTNEQEQEVDQEVDQENDQSETNIQANELDTGNNTATVTQVNDAAQEVAAASEAESEDGSGDSHDGKDKKKHDYSGSSSDTDSTSADAEAIANAAAEATGIQDQNNTANIDQDSSADDNILVNENEFGDDTNIQVAVPISDQDQTAANLAANLDLNIDIIEEEVPPTPPAPDDGEDGVFCFTSDVEGNVDIVCFETSAECETGEDIVAGFGTIVEGCAEFPTIPPGGLECTIDPGGQSISCGGFG